MKTNLRMKQPMQLKIKQLCILIGIIFLVSPASASQCEHTTLDILLTNDDGYSTPAIKTLHKALANAGHRVKRIAPEKNFSGSSASITFSKISAPQIPDHDFNQVYAVSGSPATTVLLGASAFFEPGELDLVISGINEGANLGPGTVMSGTVGATTAATQALQPSIPAIAVSTNLLAKDPAAAENKVLYQQISDFMVSLVDQLQQNSCHTNNPLLPEKTALNINYPPLSPEEIKGVRIAEQGRAVYFSIGYTRMGDDTFVPSISTKEPDNDNKRGDTVLFNQGFITITPLNGDMSARPTRALKKLEKLQP